MTGIEPEFVATPGNPSGVVVSRDGLWAFVSLTSSIATFALDTFPPHLVATVSVNGQPAGEALTVDGRYLLAALNSGAAILDVGRTEAGEPDAIVGSLSSPDGSGAVEVMPTLDGRFAFVSLEGSSESAVFHLEDAAGRGLSNLAFVGYVPLGQAPVGVALSPDGRWLYALSEAATGAALLEANIGVLSVIDIDKAEADPKSAVVSTVAAGCSPVRVVVTGDGRTVWVTDRGSDTLMSFSADKLRTDPGEAVGSQLRVGAAPVGLALVNGDRDLVVADSNRFSAPGAMSDLMLVAIEGVPHIIGKIQAGAFPRNIAVAISADMLLVTNYTSKQVEVVRLSDLRSLA